MVANKEVAAKEDIIVGEVYKNKANAQEVIPYFLDFAGASVQYSPVGRSSEGRLSTVDFLGQFDYVGPVSSMAEKQVSNEARLKEIEADKK